MRGDEGRGVRAHSVVGRGVARRSACAAAVGSIRRRAWSPPSGRLTLSNFRFDRAQSKRSSPPSPDCTAGAASAGRFRPAVQGHAGDRGRARRRRLLAPELGRRRCRPSGPTGTAPIPRRAGRSIRSCRPQLAPASANARPPRPVSCRSSPIAPGSLRLDARAHDVLGGVGQSATARRRCSCTAARAPARPPVHRRFFDPAHWRIVIFDQRGGGRSTPLGETARQFARPSGRRYRDGCAASSASRSGWCSAARGARPWRCITPRPIRERCAGLVLRGIFLCRQRRSTGSSTACARCFPRRGGPLRGFCRRRSAATCSPPITAG